MVSKQYGTSDALDSFQQHPAFAHSVWEIPRYPQSTLSLSSTIHSPTKFLYTVVVLAILMHIELYGIPNTVC